MSGAQRARAGGQPLAPAAPVALEPEPAEPESAEPAGDSVAVGIGSGVGRSQTLSPVSVFQ